MSPRIVRKKQKSLVNERSGFVCGMDAFKVEMVSLAGKGSLVAAAVSSPFRLSHPSHCVPLSLRNFKLGWQVDQTRANPRTVYHRQEEQRNFPNPELTFESYFS